jgi:hypothetical protein
LDEGQQQLMLQQQENNLMKYMLLYANESDMPKTSAEIQAAAPAWRAFGEEANAAGVWISGN